MHQLKLKVRSKSIVVTLSTKAISLALVIVDNNSNTTSLLPGKKREFQEILLKLVQFNSKIFRKLKVTYIVRKVNKVKEKFLHQHLINTCEMMIFRSVKHHIKNARVTGFPPVG